MGDVWYRETDKWQRDSPHHPAMVPKSGTKWHLVDGTRSTPDQVFAACDRGDGGLKALRVQVILEEATRVKPGSVIPTPGRGSTCARCYKLGLNAAGIS